MAPNFLVLATTLENLGARRLLAKKVNFVPWRGKKLRVCGNMKMSVGYIRQHYTTYSKIKLINYSTLLRLSLLQANRFYLEYLRLIHIQMLIVSLQSRLLSAWIFQNQHGT